MAKTALKTPTTEIVATKTATKKTASSEGAKSDFSVEAKLSALFELQSIDSTIDKIRIVRGELPVEVSDLEDEVAGLETRVNKLTDDANQLEDAIVNKKQAIKESLALIKKYEGQQNNVKNNREYDSLTKEIEFQNLEIQLSEKRIKEYTLDISTKNMIIEASRKTLDDRTNDLKIKKAELESIIQETQKEEQTLMGRSVTAAAIIEDRLLIAYKKIRENSKNGLAVVGIQRDACGGCFNKIPPQRQLDIRQRKKIIVCEHCGRILVDAELANKDAEVVAQ
jgi:predicted  nucleic acid-binding Zn-ribbon protein